MSFYDLLRETYEQERYLENFIKVCNEEKIPPNVYKEHSQWIFYNYESNVNGINGAVEDYVNLLC